MELEDLPDEVLTIVLACLPGHALSACRRVSRRLLPLGSEASLWRSVLAQEHSGIGEQLRAAAQAAGAHDGRRAPADVQLELRCHARARAATHIGANSWRLLQDGQESVDGVAAALFAQEGHAGALLGGRLWLVVCGWSVYGIVNIPCVFDTWSLEAPARQWRRRASGAMQGYNCAAESYERRPGSIVGVPNPACDERGVWRRVEDGGSHSRLRNQVYGHACAAIGERSLAMFGGCTLGGYRGDVGELRLLHLRRGDAASAEWLGRWEVPTIAAGGAAHSCAYHSLTAAELPGAGGAALVAFGGLHAGAACNVLQVREPSRRAWQHHTSPNAVLTRGPLGAAGVFPCSSPP